MGAARIVSVKAIELSAAAKTVQSDPARQVFSEVFLQGFAFRTAIGADANKAVGGNDERQ
jgi:hypothetical protein